MKEQSSMTAEERRLERKAAKELRRQGMKRPTERCASSLRRLRNAGWRYVDGRITWMGKAT